jgi:hypothetical protein
MFADTESRVKLDANGFVKLKVKLKVSEALSWLRLMFSLENVFESVFMSEVFTSLSKFEGTNNPTRLFR